MNAKTEEMIGQLLASQPYKLIFSTPRACQFRRAEMVLKEGTEGAFFQISRYTEKQVFHENMPIDGTEKGIRKLLEQGFCQIDSFGTKGDCLFRLSKKGEPSLIKRAPSGGAAAKAVPHNDQKNYILTEGQVIPPLVDLGVFTKEGRVATQMYDKYRQINRFIEMVADALPEKKNGTLRVIDFGCGKSYLTFILYYYLTAVRGLDAQITGLDLKAEVIEHCNAIAEKYGYDGLRFQLGDIADYSCKEPPDMVITLHACDTATDFALANAVKWGSKMIFSVPCCQHELNSQIESERLGAITKYGIIKERTAALMTDAIRGCLLEYSGYKTQLLEFVDLAHSPKNILIRAVKSSVPTSKRQSALKDAESLMAEFNLKPTLHRLLCEK